jgi:3-oxoacyl-[acyl-carrier protein] reductase
MTHDYSRCTDRVAIVTGGSRGVGREVVRKLANRDYAVVVGYARDQVVADTIVEEVLATNGTALTVRADVADELDVERLFTETTEAFGGVDVVVHTAGQIVLGPIADYGLDNFDALQRTNVRGTFLVNQQASRHLRDGGAIVNLSSSAVGRAVPATAAYAASKAAVEAITRVLASELRARDIAVNAAAPAPKNLDDATAIAEVVAFLVSRAGHSINGQVIRLNDSTA